MAYPDWETAGLPRTPLLDGNERQAVSMRVVFEPDRGSPMQRAGSTLANFIFPWNFMLSSAEKGAFIAFFHTTLNQGSSRFTAWDPYENELCTMQFIGDYSLRLHSPGVWGMQSTVRRVS